MDWILLLSRFECLNKWLRNFDAMGLQVIRYVNVYDSSSSKRFRRHICLNSMSIQTKPRFTEACSWLKVRMSFSTIERSLKCPQNKNNKIMELVLIVRKFDRLSFHIFNFRIHKPLKFICSYVSHCLELGMFNYNKYFNKGFKQVVRFYLDAFKRMLESTHGCRK